MRSIGVVVMVAVGVGGSSGCFSTARYEDAHGQRVASITAHYEAETQREQQHQAELAAVIEGHRALLIPIKPGSLSVPAHRVDEREDIVECRNQCDRCGIEESLDGTHPNDLAKAQCLRDICRPAYVDALTSAYFQADVHWVTSQLAISEGAELEALLAFSHNQAVSRHIEDEVRELARQQAQTRERLERDRQAAVGASAQQRDSEIVSGRAEHRARVQAAAFAARDPGPVAARAHGVCLAGDPRSSLAAGCRSGLPLPAPAPAPSPRSARVSGAEP